MWCSLLLLLVLVMPMLMMLLLLPTTEVDNCRCTHANAPRESAYTAICGTAFNLNHSQPRSSAREKAQSALHLAFVFAQTIMPHAVAHKPPLLPVEFTQRASPLAPTRIQVECISCMHVTGCADPATNAPQQQQQQQQHVCRRRRLSIRRRRRLLPQLVAIHSQPKPSWGEIKV